MGRLKSPRYLLVLVYGVKSLFDLAANTKSWSLSNVKKFLYVYNWNSILHK